MSVAAGRVWWLYGPPCVGKSVTAWELFTHALSGEPRGYFDVDQVGMCHPDPEGDAGRYALKARAAGALVRRMTRAGARTVVVSGVLDGPSLAHLVDDLDPAAVTFCRLRVGPAELRRRLEGRYGPEDVERALAEAEEWDRHGAAHPVVDTGEGTPRDIARRVVKTVTAAAPSVPRSTSSPASSAPAAPGPSRAVLICGPTAVGKSTVGFGLFMRLSETRRVAYLDLQQLGFLADLAADGPGRHQIIAGCVADLWQQYRSVGAQDLVLTGQVEQLDDVQRYRDALGATPLLVCRLQADSQTLQERISARTRGGGPSLAGDALLGLSAEDTDTVLQHALAQQSHLQELEIADFVLDSQGESPEAVTQLIGTSLRRASESSPSH